MNPCMTQSINELVFMQPLCCFKRPDAILYLPGHFPELNKPLLSYYHQAGEPLLLIPSVFNSFLNHSEFDFYAPLLMDEGVQSNKLLPILASESNTEGIIKAAFQFLNQTNHTNIMLAGKSFFCRRFFLLSSLYADNKKVLDILPLQDSRNITPATWTESDKGIFRILNELNQYGEIAKKGVLSDVPHSISITESSDV